MSDQPPANIILGIKLDGTNYPLWSRLMKVAIGGRRKAKHITNSPPSSKKEEKEFQTWEEDDLIVFSWIIQNMETRLVQRFAQHQTSKALWDSLAITYGSGADPLQIYDLEIQASKMSQEGQTLEKFWSELHNIWTEIDQRDPNPLECCDKGILTY
ncbi:Unknown protein [Striga hermonthica]|uniref:Retrotransposon Copia-like N-terminal domain-containing protein n=1 Tax=Striga hermonthica TaxID=68872 RepID=A0A9N7NI54_STRHE|nr:Unknown protein [Striga hermonthica]